MTTKEERTKPWILSTIPTCFGSLRPWEDLRKRYHVIEWGDYLKNEEGYAEKIDVVLVIIGGVDIKEAHLQKMSNLKFYQNYGTGTDHLDIPLLRKYKIRLGNSPGGTTNACADFAMTLLLATARRLTECMASSKTEQAISDFNWESVAALVSKGVSGAILGIFGMGTIGFEVAKRAKAFGMKIFYHNRRQRSKGEETEVQATYCSSIEALLPQVDFLVLVAPLTPKTRHVMNRETFKLMKPDSILVNIARGGLVNHDHLVEALRNRTIGGAAMDVTEPEPLPPDHALLTMPNVIVTPHISACTTESLETTLQIVVDNIDAVIDGRELLHEVF